ncbi:DUF4192 domain-containing protein [Amycolatopsis sp. cg9]|uniref:DUF4192 domain-containing protein n=1 Tax=Amycolatopsis sp. cg9 TaxID=3238801 RepID=UPI003524F3E4
MPLALASTSLAVASIPALIGFIPDDSLVLITTLTNDDGTATTGPLTRIDLSQLTAHGEDCVRQFNRQCADLPVLCVTGILVRTLDEDASSGEPLPMRPDVDTVVELLTEHGFTDVDLVHIPAITEGTRWRSYLDTDRTGVLPDPGTTPAAVAAVATGHTIAGSRDHLATRFTPAPGPLRARLQSRISDAVESAAIDVRWHLAAHVRLDRADAAILAAAHGELPTDDAAIVDLAATFATLPFRDALLAVLDYATRLAAESLVLHLWRHSCDPVATRLATVVAMHAYLRGDGAGARIALENADLEQPLALLLSRMLDHAVPPSKVHHVFQNASADARRTLLGKPAVDPA